MNLKEITLELLEVFEQKLHITVSKHQLIKRLCSLLPAFDFDLSSTVTVLRIFCDLLDHDMNPKFSTDQQVTIKDVANELSLLVSTKRAEVCPRLVKLEDAAVLMFLAFIGGCATFHKGAEVIEFTLAAMTLDPGPIEKST